MLSSKSKEYHKSTEFSAVKAERNKQDEFIQGFNFQGGENSHLSLDHAVYVCTL